MASEEAHSIGQEAADRLMSGQLFDSEVIWAARYERLRESGYLLRPRYRPGWIAPWKPGDNILFEEQAMIAWSKKLDAERISDGVPVFLKPIPKSSPEIPIGILLTSDKLRDDSRNHAVPLLDVIEDPTDPDGVILVLPMLRRIDSPLPGSVKECLELVEQTLEGLVFLHELQVAHRDCAWGNIMMDGRALFPNGWHPQGFRTSKNGKEPVPIPSLREVDRLRYYFIDFGISTVGEDMTVGTPGQERAPELSADIPYDPYKLDVYILGMAYKRLLGWKFRNIDFLKPLIDFMTAEDPSQRPTALASYERFKELRDGISSQELRRRLPLRESSESNSTRLWNDLHHAILDFWWSYKTKRTVGPLS
ncbi:hypothetical protein FRC01_013737 [Tulasnella sp. 417]|nr:hypothetical protein FRC01_013737 [Tulasnella sp. 417]